MVIEREKPFRARFANLAKILKNIFMV